VPFLYIFSHTMDKNQ